MPRYAVAAERARVGTGRPVPVPPWHAADLLDDDPRLHAGQRVVSLCGVAALLVFPLDWNGLVAGNGCAECRDRAARAGSSPA